MRGPDSIGDPGIGAQPCGGTAEGVVVGVVVVLFHPSAQQLDRLAMLASQAPLLTVVDNSVPPLLAEKLAFRGNARNWLGNANRGGIAAAFNLGARNTFALGAGACLLLDQDSVLDPGFLERMSQVCTDCEATGLQQYILGPKILDANSGEFVPSFSGGRFRLRAIHVDRLAGHELVPCSMLINSGSVVSRAAWTALGPWREDFMLDHVDSDYCLRAVTLGVPCMIVPWLTLRHTIGHKISKRFLGVRLGAMNHSASRRYYLARNALAMARHHPGYPLAVLLYNLLTLSQVIAVLLLETGKRAKLHAIALGLVDGMLGRSGALESWHPIHARQWRSTGLGGLAESLEANPS